MKLGTKDEWKGVGFGCLLLIGSIGLLIATLYFGYMVFSGLASLRDNEPTTNNPYEIDWNGDGVGGTKSDHDYYHKYKK